MIPDGTNVQLLSRERLGPEGGVSATSAFNSSRSVSCSGHLALSKLQRRGDRSMFNPQVDVTDAVLPLDAE
jgi:hypothetical protein